MVIVKHLGLGKSQSWAGNFDICQLRSIISREAMAGIYTAYIITISFVNIYENVLSMH